jgi:hypothetical protein
MVRIGSLNDAMWFRNYLCALSLLLGMHASAEAAFDEPASCTTLPALTGVVTSTSGSCATANGTVGLVKISNQTVSAGASIAFTGLATYTNYQLACTGVFPATNATTVNLQVGEGGTPTWETSSYFYGRIGIASNSSTVNGVVSESASGVLVVSGNTNTVAASVSFVATIMNVTSTNTTKMVTFMANEFDVHVFPLFGGGAYTGDNNAITAVRIIAASGNISGNCTLYGMLP